MAVYIGHQVQTTMHAHHAIEIIILFNEPFLISKDGIALEKSNCSIIAADLPHQFTGKDDFYIFIYLDPALNYAHKLDASLHLKKNKLVHYGGDEIAELRSEFVNWFNTTSIDDEKVNNLIVDFVGKLTGTENFSTQFDDRIKHSVELIHSNLLFNISLPVVASSVHLSESRFAHLFKEQTGIPFRKYILWCRIQAAVKAISEEQSFTMAAYSGGFSDIAHLSRTFTTMFGVSPSQVLKY